MDTAPAYRAWHPSAERDGTVSVLLTGGTRRRAPSGGREFFEHVLAVAGVDADLVAWGVHPFVTSYFTANGWEECWNAILLTAGAVRLPDHPVEGVAVLAEPDREDEPATYLPLRVVADFGRRADAMRCRADLRGIAAEARWNEIHYERYLFRDVAARHQQLCVDITTAERGTLPDLVPAARKVMAVCVRHGGRVQVGDPGAGRGQ
jgi:hypothetical protein